MVGEEVTGDIKTQLACVVFVLRTEKNTVWSRWWCHTVLMAHERVYAACGWKDNRYQLLAYGRSEVIEIKACV